MNRPPAPKSQPLFLIIALILIGYLGATTTSAIYKSYQNKDRLQALQQDVKQLHLRQAELQQQLAYQKSDIFIEDQARNKLNLARPNETVAIFPRQRVLAAQNAKEGQAAAHTSSNQSNFSNWFEFFVN